MKVRVNYPFAEANLSCNVSNDAWILDTTTSNHFTDNQDLFINFVDIVNENMVLELLRKNLMSCPMLDQNGLKFIGENGRIKVYAGNKLIFKAILEQGLYYAYPNIEPKYASSVEKAIKIEGEV
ncbi:hypothetical protein TNIN_186131 [Trichonephila inaurata madagascariensis]|uniref:Uncharacterized protein n=1 Tax=Trichonephila inaurata madagascariensis TaxID=2747483 RepID=A0A8X7BS80_9ARAC|nr:hypothetical protein TNIN_186131 [Trichonephila inaurata madagascariensis]